MKILSHRGYWKSESDKNTLESLKKALFLGYGFESDIRDYDGSLVISHNCADKNCPSADLIFEELAKYNDKYCFAINIKADGLKDELLALINKYKITNYFTFDMSVPQMVEYIEKDITVFTRQSEYEEQPVFYKESKGVWIDGFENLDWITEDLLKDHIRNNKLICIVSPELHQREYEDFWKKLISFDIDFSKVYLCTDVPDKAKVFFGDKICK